MILSILIAIVAFLFKDMREESNKISMEEFNDYFGPIYLNTPVFNIKLHSYF